MPTIFVTVDGEQQSLLEIEGPLPCDLSKYGAAWSLYRYKVAESGQLAQTGEVHALPEEGLIRLIERISIRLRR